MLPGRRVRTSVKLAILWLAAVAAPAQVPRIGDIDVYGLRKVPREKLLAAAGVREGDLLPGSKGDLEERIEAIPGVVLASVEALCCEDGKAILFIGVEEKGAPHFAFRSEPAGRTALPEDLVETYRKFLEAVQEAARRGGTAEDLTRGHALMADPAARELQQRFAAFAADRVPVLRECLRTCPEPEQRAIAATVIGYAPRKRDVLDDLQSAMQDPDPAVRANAMRALAAIAVLAARDPALEIRIPATWFVEMLNSIYLSDRLKAAEALVNLTEKNNPAALDQIRARALPAVIEMARWKTLRYALPSFILAGRLAGMAEKQIQEEWSAGRREPVLARLTRKR